MPEINLGARKCMVCKKPPPEKPNDRSFTFMPGAFGITIIVCSECTDGIKKRGRNLVGKVQHFFRTPGAR